MHRVKPVASVIDIVPGLLVVAVLLQSCREFAHASIGQGLDQPSTAAVVGSAPRR